ncbi:hypothetical protein M885DRAFT_518832 [Pelagophyceae sp. CCMP2097]|nr:hypothetical protein M885DRAFT_518832 [Pelagophyceae sp. CCMP2097]
MLPADALKNGASNNMRGKAKYFGHIGGSLAGRLGENTYVVDYAKDARSFCREISCKGNIPKDSLRLGKVPPKLHSPRHSSARTQWFHCECIFRSFSRMSKTTRTIETWSDVRGIEAVRPEDQEWIYRLVSQSLQDDQSRCKKPPFPPPHGAPPAPTPHRGPAALPPQLLEDRYFFDEVHFSQVVAKAPEPKAEKAPAKVFEKPEKPAETPAVADHAHERWAEHVTSHKQRVVDWWLDADWRDDGPDDYAPANDHVPVNLFQDEAPFRHDYGAKRPRSPARSPPYGCAARKAGDFGYGDVHMVV